MPPVSLRAAVVLLAVCLRMLSPSLAFCQQFPYTLKVAAETPYYGQAEVSGTPAGQLPAGSSLEVYRHDGDWLAIRPPEGSFSWVSTRDVEATSQAGVVRVRANGATCWIGHEGSESRTVSQVTLEQGELLQVLGDSLVGDENQVQQWYRVAPPAGEFRFVHSRHVGAVAAAAPIGTGVKASPAGWAARNAGTAAPATAPVAIVATTPTTVPAGAVAAMGPSQATQPQAWPTHVAPPIQPQIQQAVSTSPVTPLPAGTSNGITEEAARARLAIIDGQLAAMLAYPPNMWNPMVVVPELQILAASAPTDALRAQAQSLWAQALQSQQVQQGYAQVAAGFHTSVQPAAGQVPSPTPRAAVQPAAYYVETPSPYAQRPLQVSPEFRPLAPRNLIAKVRQATFNVADTIQTGGQVADYGRGETPSAAASREPEPLDWPVDENGHAGTGWLMPLVARSQMPLESRAGVPPLALTDDEGNVKFLVTPSTGANLREYLRKEVGIVGPVSRLPDIATPHITAQRVVVLQRHE